MYRYLWLLIFFHNFSFAAPTNIIIEWTYKNIKGLKIELHEVDEKIPLWNTKNSQTLENTGIKDLIKDNSLTVEPNRRRKFALVAFNNTNKPIYFFAAPHSTTPDELSLGLRFKCLCVNHAFKIEPKMYWYRVVELRLDPGYNAKKMKITHSIIGVDSKKAKEFRNEHSDEE